MANSTITYILPKRIADIYKDLNNVTSKLHRTAGSIGFIKKALYNDITPKFAQVKGNFVNNNDRYKSERSVLLSHLNEHILSYKKLIDKHHSLLN